MKITVFRKQAVSVNILFATWLSCSVCIRRCSQWQVLVVDLGGWCVNEQHDSPVTNYTNPCINNVFIFHSVGLCFLIYHQIYSLKLALYLSGQRESSCC